MNGNCHKIGGLCAGSIAVCLTGNLSDIPLFLLQSVLIIGASGVGSLVPDIDEPNSKAGRKIKPVSYLIKSASGHRGPFHSPFLVILLGFLMYYAEIMILPELTTDAVSDHSLFYSVYESVCFGFLTGYSSHILLDLLNSRGVPLLWPLTSRKFHLMNLKTNRDEGIVNAAMILTAAIVFCRTVFMHIPSAG